MSNESTKTLSRRPTLHRILLSARTNSYRHLANKLIHIDVVYMYVMLHVDVVDIEYTIGGLGISVGVEIPPLLHICLSFDDGLHTLLHVLLPRNAL